MGLIKGIDEKPVASANKQAINERSIYYRSTFFRLTDMMTQMSVEMDKSLLTFSIAVLAALAALNNNLFEPYGWLSFITFVCFVGVVISVIVGFLVSKMMLVEAQKILTENYKKSSSQPLGEGLDRTKYKSASKFINITSILLFILGMIFFVSLIALYIKRY